MAESLKDGVGHTAESIVDGVLQPTVELEVPYNGKIADINHADANKHTLDLATALSETREIVSVKLSYVRIAGTGSLLAYSNEGTTGVIISSFAGGIPAYVSCIDVKELLNRLQYQQTVANDDFDLYCHGYKVKRD